ncbi:MAG: nitrous oxide reductase accessory protein NosL [Phycisphaerales bacterium]
MKRALMVLATAVLAGVVGSCSRGGVSGPPVVHAGRDECRGCGMLINEDRCSSACIVEAAGVQEYALYDDIGCMLDHQREAAGVKFLSTYVHDYGTRAWVGAERAAFVWFDGDEVSTPMGSHIVAFGAERDAVEAAARHPGRVMSFVEVGQVRQAWMEARWGKPEQGR